MRRRASLLRWCALSAVCALAVVTAGTSAAARSTRQHVISTPGTIPLRTALFDPIFWGPQRAMALPMARAAGASYVRLFVEWRAIAPATPPQGFVAADPTSPGYTWAQHGRDPGRGRGCRPHADPRHHHTAHLGVRDACRTASTAARRTLPTSPTSRPRSRRTTTASPSARRPSTSFRSGTSRTSAPT